MKRKRYRAWAFAEPTRDQRAVRAGGLRVSASGGMAMVSEEASVRQAIILLLATRPGERVMRPGYGCDLHRLIFSPNDASTAGLAIHYVRQAVQRWEPRVNIVRIDAGPGGDGATLEIVLEYQLRRTGMSERLTFGVDLLVGGANAVAYSES